MSKKECCPVMALVLERNLGAGRFGIERAPWFSVTGKSTGVSIIIRFPKGKDKSQPHHDATYAEFSWCPFCGADLRRKKSAKKAKKHEARDA